MKNWMKSVVIFLLGVGWFSIFMPWHGFNDPDAFYHAKMSALVWASGPVKSFPWLDLTLLGSQFADLHFLFHVMVAPLTKIFGMFDGLRVSQVIFAGILLVVFEWGLRQLEVSKSEWWTLLLASLSPVIIRLTLGKASGLALIWFVLGLMAMWSSKPRKFVLVFIATLLFAWSHGGWPILVGAIGLVALGDVVYEKLMKRKRFFELLKGSLWREVLAGVLGGVVGMVVHPNFPETFLFSWTQVVTIGLGTPFAQVQLGNEWLPADFLPSLVSFAPVVAVSLLGAMGFVFAQQEFEERKAKKIFTATFVLGVLVMFLFKSRRMAEYVAPVAVMWCAFLWEMVEVKKAKREGEKIFAEYTGWQKKVGGMIFLLLVVGMFGKNFFQTYKMLNPPKYTDGYLRVEMGEIHSRAKEGERVFHVGWNDFPAMWAADDGLKFVYGVDPTFLYVSRPELSDRMYAMSMRPSSTTVGEIEGVMGEMGARFVLLSKNGQVEPLFELLRTASSSYRSVIETDTAQVFEKLK